MSLRIQRVKMRRPWPLNADGGLRRFRMANAAGVHLTGTVEDVPRDLARGQVYGAGLPVVQARAELVPFRSESVDGLVCKVVLSYTDEVSNYSNAETRPYVRYLMVGLGWKIRFSGLRIIVNSWFYAATEWRVPRLLENTLYQTPHLRWR